MSLLRPAIMLALFIASSATAMASDVNSDSPAGAADAMAADSDSPASAADAQAGRAPVLHHLTPEQHDIVWGIKGDPEPEVRNAYRKENEGQHFTTCDELNLHLFEPAIRGIGGAYAGVGTDQAYIFMGWARSEIGWMLDYDPLVIRIHGLYRVFFMEAENFERFLHLWSAEGAAEAREVIRRRVSFEPAAESALELYAKFRAHINRRLMQSMSLMRKAGVAFYLNDAATYDHVRNLVMTGRAVAVQANLLADGGIKNIGEASRRLGVPVRALYLSNVEDYWAYGSQYMNNLQSLPYDDTSMILRTLAAKKSNGDYRYVQQKATNLLKWLESGKVRRTRDMFRRGAIRKSDEVQLVTIETDPDKKSVR